MDNHLMVDEFVALGKLDYSVKREHLAKSRAFKNTNILKLAFSFKYFFFEAKDIPFTSSYSGKSRFNKPLFWIETNFLTHPAIPFFILSRAISFTKTLPYIFKLFS